MITDYEYKIDNVVEFKKIRNGDTFEYHNTLYFKIPKIVIDDYRECNAIRVHDLSVMTFDDSYKVLPVDSKLMIYK